MIYELGKLSAKLLAPGWSTVLEPYGQQNVLRRHMIAEYDFHHFLSRARFGARRVSLAKTVSRAPALTKAVDVEELYPLALIVG